MATRISLATDPVVAPTDVVVEEPLEIRMGDQRVATTMRTPGHDFELAAGFCHSEGHLSNNSVRHIRYCGTGSDVDTAFNVVCVETELPLPEIAPRATVVSSSCGICGSDHIESLTERLAPLTLPASGFDTDVLVGLGERVAGVQPLFEETGGSHAAAVFSLADGSVSLVREDIGRHNALDKVVGHLLLSGELPLATSGVWISGRASFEMVQKAWAAGFPLVVSVSAPSAMAVAVAAEANLALAGFAREDRATIYHWPSGWERR